MSEAAESTELFIEETKRKPNLYAANVLAGVVGVIAIVFVMNELGVFAVNRILVHICFFTSVAMFAMMQFFVHRPKWIVHPACKYVIIGMVLLLVLTLTVLLNIHAVLAFVLPLLLATQYRSHRVSLIALVGACVCCGIAPILSYCLGTWSLTFMTGYIQTFCRVTINAIPGNGMCDAEAIRQITLYWSLPQMLTIGAFGFILYSATKSSIDSVEHQIQVVNLSNDLSGQLASILTMQEKVLFAMSDIIESRDLETGGHVRRTSEIVRLLMDAMRGDADSGVTDAFYHDVIKSAPMHDLGKIAIADAILQKPGRLTAEEYEVVKRHSVRSAEIIEQALTGIEDEQLLVTAKNIAKYHHERVDGTGYPERLKGKEIPLEARIMAIADVYDALVSERCYKAPMSFEEAFDTIEAAMGTQFDADLNRYFVACRAEIERFYRE